jgi:hypothetical protein
VCVGSGWETWTCVSFINDVGNVLNIYVSTKSRWPFLLLEFYDLDEHFLELFSTARLSLCALVLVGSLCARMLWCTLVCTCLSGRVCV